jgi:thymidine kinase
MTDYNNNVFIIDGNIGSGKSSVLKFLKQNYTEKIRIIEEKFINENNEMDPIIQKFYDNPKEYGFLAQIKILMTHMRNKKLIKEEYYNNDKNQNNTLLFERSPLSCINIFGEQLIADNIINEDQQQITKEINDNFGWLPKNIIYINTPPDECYNRIKKRARNGEGNIPLTYLEDLHNRYEKLYCNHNHNHNHNHNNPSTYNIENIWILDGKKSTEELSIEIINIIDKK